LTRLTIGLRTELSNEQRDLYDQIAHGRRSSDVQHFALTDENGVLNGPFNAFLLSPGLGEAVQAVGARLRFQSTMSDRVRELCILEVAAHWGSEFEWTAHEPIARSVGLSDEIEIVKQRASNTLQEPAELLALDVVRQMLTAGDLDDSTYDAAAAALGESQVFELSTLVGYYSMLALQMRIFRVS
jgi:4-carboxymuconolactone decarboxylase